MAKGEGRLKDEVGALARLSAPVALTQVGLMMTGVIDTVMVSRLGVAELAASALGNMWNWSFLSLGLGIVMGIDPLISQAHGRGDGPGAALGLQRGIVLALAMSVPLTLGMLFTREGLVALGQDAALAELAAHYNLYRLPTIACFLVYSALRQYLQGRGLMAAATWVMWLGNVLHVVLNWGLIFGRFGLPALGLTGAAIASSITTLVQLIGLVVWVQGFGLHRAAWRAWDAASFSPRGVLQAARLGLPVGAQFASEAWAFSIATLLAGQLGPEAVGAHQIVLNLAALAFMVPVGIAQGTSARVGNLVGLGDAPGMRRAAAAGVLLSAGVMSVSASLYLLFRHGLPRLFTDEHVVLSLASTIMPVAAAFQLADGTQVVAAGILRGLGRTDAAAVANVVGFYLVGLPLSYVVGIVWQQGLVGVWWGLALGLLFVATLLLLRVIRTVRRPLSELTVDVRG